MGQEIVYCCRCQTQLRSRDFEKGAAFRLDARATCLKCAPEVMRSLPNEAVQSLLKQMSAPRNPSSNRSTTRIRTVQAAAAGAVPPEPATNLTGILIAAVVGVGFVVVVLISASGSSRRIDEPRASSGPKEVALPAPPSPGPRPPPDPVMKPAPPPGVDPLKQARDYVRSNPSDYAGQVDFYERALEALRTSPARDEVKRELDAVRKVERERIATELARLDLGIRDLCAREEFGPAQERIEDARRLLISPDWTVALKKRTDDVYLQASVLFASVKQTALYGSKEDGKAAQDRVARWGLPAFIADLGSALSGKPTTAPASPEETAFARCRETAFAHAYARDYVSASTELKRGTDALKDGALLKAAAEDAEALRQAALALKDVQQLPSKWAKGQKLALDVVNAGGTVDRIDGTLLRWDPFRVEIERAGADPAVVLVGQALVGPLALLAKAAGNARGLALLCLLEGDADAARSLIQGAAVEIPERYWTWAKDRSASVDARELLARSQLGAAERAYEDASSAAESALQHAALLKTYPDTPVVRRNRAFIELRSQGAKDYILFPEDMTAGGSYARVKNPKTESGYTSQADTDPSKTSENFVEVPFSALPDLEYRCWVYVGACCAETFTFYYQATNLVGLPSKEAKDAVACEPGSGASLLAKHTLTSLKKTHSLHTGPKAPTRWEWIQLPLPKYAAAGPKKLRLLTNQQGFTVAFVAISASKSAHPRETEFKSWESARNQTPGARTLNRNAPLPAEKPAANDLAVVFSLDLAGGKKPASISKGTVVNTPERPDKQFFLAAENRPDGVSSLYLTETNPFFIFEGEEVLTFDYWVDPEVTNVNFNFYNRTQQAQFFGILDKPVTGKWTHASFRLQDLLNPTARFKPGDTLADLYMQAVGGTTRKFFVANVQVTRPRPRK